MFSPKMQANAPMKNRIPVPPVMLRPMYAPSAVHPTVTRDEPHHLTEHRVRAVARELAGTYVDVPNFLVCRHLSLTPGLVLERKRYRWRVAASMGALPVQTGNGSAHAPTRGGAHARQPSGAACGPAYTSSEGYARGVAAPAAGPGRCGGRGGPCRRRSGCGRRSRRRRSACPDPRPGWPAAAPARRPASRPRSGRRPGSRTTRPSRSSRP